MPLIAANGTQLYYDLTGPADAPVIVFSNSIGTSVEMWEPQQKAFSGRYRILRYDTRGHGRSPVVDQPATIETLAEDLAGLLDELDIWRVHLVGLSLGGMTAQQFAATWPERVHGLVLMATAAHLPGDWNDRAARVRANGMDAIASALPARWFTPAYQDTGTARALLERVRATDPRGYAVCCGVIAALDLRAGNAAITAPTLIIAGANDPATPVAMAEEIRGTIPGASMVVLPNAAHILNLEQAAAVNGQLSLFLDSLDGPAAAAPGGVSFEAGLANRKAVLGAEHVARSLANAGAFARPWQDFITRVAWGEIWGDDTIPWKTRSMVTLSLMVALGREEEFKLHIRPALKNGVTLPELRALLLQCAVYCGVPAVNGAFRWVKEVLGEAVEG